MEIKGILEIKETPFISPSSISEWDSCHKRYWFSHILHYPSKPNSGMAIGKLVHRIMDRMWKWDEERGVFLPYYKSYRQCVNCAGVGNWKRNYAEIKKKIKPEKAKKTEIEWNEYDKNGWAPWIIGRVAETVGLIYTRALTDGPPLRKEFEIKVEYPPVRIRSILDELRRGENGSGIVIRDHKSGVENSGGYYASKNIQLTMNGMCVFEALQHPHTEVSRLFPEYRGISLEDFLNDVLEVQINEIYPRHPRDAYGHLPETKIHQRKRKILHCNEALQTFQSFYDGLKKRDFHPNPKECNRCFFKEVCDDYDPAEYNYQASKEDLQLSLFTPEINPHFSNLTELGLVKEEFGQNKEKDRNKTFRFPVPKE